MKRFTVACDYDGGTYVSQFDGLDPVDIARQWSVMLRTDRPISRSSAHIANRVLRDLESECGPCPLDGLVNVWQIGAPVGRGFYTATIVQQG
jgi:hypothetical protein